jgi:eukaryotic-like serine/threonine-protein kinase
MQQPFPMQVLAHVATRLRDMHAAGYVHRDIKPGNIMYLPRKNRWTVIDFGCTAKAGCSAPLSFTLHFSPPEVVRAYLAHDREVIAEPAMDSWAIKVVAFELLTGIPIIDPMVKGRDKVSLQHLQRLH